MNWEPGKRYRITYSPESGETSERTIDVIGTSQAYGGKLYIRAFYRLRVATHYWILKHGRPRTVRRSAPTPTCPRIEEARSR